METTGSTARGGLIIGLASVEATVTLAASAARHASWWLDWHTRTHPGGAGHGSLPDQPVAALVQLIRAA